MPVVAGAGEALRGNSASLRTGTGLQDVEKPEPDGLLDLVVAVELDVGPAPEVIEVPALVGEQAVPARLHGFAERGLDLVAQRGHRAVSRPAVRDELHDQPWPA